MLAQSLSSFLDSDSVGESLADFGFATDGPLFAELLQTVDGGAFEADENINIMDLASDSEEEIEKYINQKLSGSDSESTIETRGIENTSNACFLKNRKNQTCQTQKIVLKKVQMPNYTKCRTDSPPELNKFVSLTPHTGRDSASMHMQEKKEDKCMSKNAVAARENRQKKKHYMDSLEQTCERLSTENSALKTSVESKDKQLKSMAQENEYLRNVLANQTALSALLNNIHHTAGLKFGTSFMCKEGETSQNLSRKRSVHQEDTCTSSDHNINMVKRQKTNNHISSESSPQTFEGPPTPCASPEPKTSGGVCLHVSNNNVSLEFCSACASSAAEVWKVSGDHNYNRVIKHASCDYVVVKQEFSDSDGE